MTLRITMWSGPRNISTALMRAWENRPDTTVSDEPLYAAYLHTTGIHHPGRAEILASQSTDWKEVLQQLLGPVPHGSNIWYQKHMAHHLLDGMDRSWLRECKVGLLIRNPVAVIASYTKTRPQVNLQDIGIAQQAELFRWLEKETHETPLVMDSDDILHHPEWMLQAMCHRWGIGFSDKMLNWPPGLRDTDGVWAPHWYANVHTSNGFGPPKSTVPVLPAGLESLAEEAMESYDFLWAHRVKP